MLEILLGLVISLVAAEFYEWCPYLSDRLLGLYVKGLPTQDQERLLEEWRALLQDTPGNLGKFFVAIDLLRGIIPIRQAIRCRDFSVPAVSIESPVLILEGHPFFIAGCEGRSRLLGELYSIDIAPPGDTSSECIHAVFGPDIRITTMSETLARDYGAEHDGDIIFLSFQQLNHLTFENHVATSIPVCVHFATPNRGDRFVRIGMDDLFKSFDISSIRVSNSNPSPDMMLLNVIGETDEITGQYWPPSSEGAEMELHSRSTRC